MLPAWRRLPTLPFAIPPGLPQNATPIPSAIMSVAFSRRKAAPPAPGEAAAWCSLQPPPPRPSCMAAWSCQQASAAARYSKGAASSRKQRTKALPTVPPLDSPWQLQARRRALRRWQTCNLAHCQCCPPHHSTPSNLPAEALHSMTCPVWLGGRLMRSAEHSRMCDKRGNCAVGRCCEGSAWLLPQCCSYQFGCRDYTGTNIHGTGKCILPASE